MAPENAVFVRWGGQEAASLNETGQYIVSTHSIHGLL